MTRRIRALIAGGVLMLVASACQPWQAPVQKTWRPDKGGELQCHRYPNCPTTTTLPSPPLHPF